MALERPGDLDSAAARFSTGMMLDVLPYVVGKKVGAPDGSTVVLTLTGPIVTTTAVATTDGRARLVDPAARDPDRLRLAGLRRLRPAGVRSPRPRRGPGDRAGGHRGRRRAGRLRWCASSTTCSEPRTVLTHSRTLRGAPMDLVTNVVTGSNAERLLLLLHGYGADERDLGGLLRLPRPRRASSRRCCRVVRSPRRPGSPGSTSPRVSPTTIAGGVRRRARRGRRPPRRRVRGARLRRAHRPSWAASRRAAGSRSRSALGPSDRTRPAGCWR